MADTRFWPLGGAQDKQQHLHSIIRPEMFKDGLYSDLSHFYRCLFHFLPFASYPAISIMVPG